MELARDFEGPFVNVRVALQSREAANIFDLERLYWSHQVPTNYCNFNTTLACDTIEGCVKYCVRGLHSMVKQWVEQLLCLPYIWFGPECRPQFSCQCPVNDFFPDRIEHHCK